MDLLLSLLSTVNTDTVPPPSRSSSDANAPYALCQPSAASQAPLTYLELKRREAQQRYLEEQEYLKQNKPLFDKMIKEQEEAMQREMPSTFWGATQAILAGGPPPPPPAGGQNPAQPETTPAKSS